MSDMSMTAGPGRSYRYYTGTPLFPVGFGLSYTGFKISSVALPRLLQWPTTDVNASQVLQVSVTNVGLRTGDEVVMAFLVPKKFAHPLKRKVEFFLISCTSIRRSTNRLQ
jgi:beta-D-xylosidase 4